MKAPGNEHHPLHPEETDDRPTDGERKELVKAELVSRLTRKIKMENLLKQKARQGGISYLWGLSFQCFKRNLSQCSFIRLARVLDQLDSDEEYASNVDSCFTQACLDRYPLDEIPRFWKRLTIYDYLLAVCAMPTSGGVESRLTDVLRASEYTSRARKKYSLEKFTPAKLMAQWGSEHHAWPIHKGRLHGRKRLGFPLPGGVISTHREYYVLPRRLPEEAAKKWGGFRLLVSKVGLSACVGAKDDGERTEREPEVHFVYYTDTHYGDDGTYEALNLPEHDGAKPYYLLGILEVLLLYGVASGKIELAHEVVREIEERAALVVQGILKTVECDPLYPHLSRPMLLSLLGLTEEMFSLLCETKVFKGWAMYNVWLDRATRSDRGL